MSNDWFKNPIDMDGAVINWAEFTRGCRPEKPQYIERFWDHIKLVLANIVEGDVYTCALQLDSGVFLFYYKKQNVIYLEPVRNVSGLFGPNRFDYHEIPSEYWELEGI